MPVVNPDILPFFKALEQNNNREWFESQKPRFKSLEGDVKAFGLQILNAIGPSEHIDKVKLFRIYRDVRFSNDKTPYKTHFGMAFHREKPLYRGGYYIHIKPGASFLGAGFWDPNKEDLYRIRKELEIDAAELRTLLNAKSFATHWDGLTGEELKTAPKNFNKEHPDIDLIRKKQYIFTKKLSDQEVLDPAFYDRVCNAFLALRPLLDYFSAVLTTNLNGEPLY